MTNPTGGRGNKAPYKTTIIRIPEPLLETVESLSTSYREYVLNPQSYPKHPPQFSSVDKDNAIFITQHILKKKKSARISLQNLLQLLYDDSNLHLHT